MTELYLLRHGQTATNLRGAFTGQMDIPLTGEGERQAIEAGERLKSWNWQPEVVVSSPLIRAQETAARVAPGHEIILEAGFAEVDMGILQGHTYKEARERWPELMERWSSNHDPIHYRLPGAESNAEVYDRAMEGLEKTLARFPDCKRLLVVTHSTVVSLLLSGLIMGGPHGLMNFAAYNARFATVEINSSHARLTGLNL